MPFLHSDILDLGLTELDTAATTELHITHTEATTRANVLTNSVGIKTGPSIGAPGARSGGGREVVVAAITDGEITVTSTGAGDDAQYWAIIDGTRLLAAGPLAAGQLVTDGNVFSTAAFAIGIPNPA